jgi:hypothetical protein
MNSEFKSWVKTAKINELRDWLRKESGNLKLRRIVFKEIMSRRIPSILELVLLKAPEYKRYFLLIAIEDPERYVRYLEERERNIKKLYQYALDMGYIDESITYDQCNPPRTNFLNMDVEL